MKSDIGYVMTDRREAKDYIEMSLEDDHNGFVWAIEEKQSGTFIGTGGLKNWYGRLCAEVGLIIDERYWNKKFGSEAVKQMVDFAFQSLQVTYVYATTLPNNTGSIRLLQRLGFQFYGWTNYYWYAYRYVKGFVFIKSKHET